MNVLNKKICSQMTNKELLFRLILLFCFILMVTLSYSIGNLIGYVEYKLGRPLNTPISFLPIDQIYYQSPKILGIFYVTFYGICWAFIPVAYYFLFPKHKYYELIKRTILMCAISLIIYIAYPTYAIRYQEFSGQHNATLFGEMPSYHIMNTMILFVSCIPTKKTKGQIILCVFTLCLFIAVMPLSIYTNRHFLIDVIVGVSIVLFVQIFFTLFKTPKFDKKLFNFFEIVIPAKFQWKRKGVSIKYFLTVIPFFLLLGALNITMEFFTNIN